VSQAYAEGFEAWSPSPFLVPLAAFAGGLLASVSPCVLAMLPLNLG
jgi:cytochrome c-type biogenesis protein